MDMGVQSEASGPALKQMVNIFVPSGILRPVVAKLNHTRGSKPLSISSRLGRIGSISAAWLSVNDTKVSSVGSKTRVNWKVLIEVKNSALNSTQNSSPGVIWEGEMLVVRLSG